MLERCGPLAGNDRESPRCDRGTSATTTTHRCRRPTCWSSTDRRDTTANRRLSISQDRTRDFLREGVDLGGALDGTLGPIERPTIKVRTQHHDSLGSGAARHPRPGRGQSQPRTAAAGLAHAARNSARAAPLTRIERARARRYDSAAGRSQAARRVPVRRWNSASGRFTRSGRRQLQERRLLRTREQGDDDARRRRRRRRSCQRQLQDPNRQPRTVTS